MRVTYTNDNENGDKLRRCGRVQAGWSKVGLSMVLQA